jgi:hypothetical protein
LLLFWLGLLLRGGRLGLHAPRLIDAGLGNFDRGNPAAPDRVRNLGQRQLE